MRLFTFALALILLQGCAHSVHMVPTSDFTPYAQIEQGTMIQARGEQFVILGLTDETNYVNRAYAGLIKSCPNGAVTGITTQLSTDLGFFSWTNRVLMQGLCIQARSE